MNEMLIGRIPRETLFVVFSFFRVTDLFAVYHACSLLRKAVSVFLSGKRQIEISTNGYSEWVICLFFVKHFFREVFSLCIDDWNFPRVFSVFDRFLKRPSGMLTRMSFCFETVEVRRPFSQYILIDSSWKDNFLPLIFTNRLIVRNMYWSFCNYYFANTMGIRFEYGIGTPHISPHVYGWNDSTASYEWCHGILDVFVVSECIVFESCTFDCYVSDLFRFSDLCSSGRFGFFNRCVSFCHVGCKVHCLFCFEYEDLTWMLQHDSLVCRSCLGI